MRILIGGEDGVAFRLAEALMQEHEVTVVLPESARGSRLDRLDVAVVHGSTISGETLKDAGVEQADLFVACTALDERNLIACAEAKRRGATEVICFLRRHDVQSNEDEATALGLSLGIGKVILPANQLAKEILEIVMVPGALEAQFLLGKRVRLVKRRVEAGAHICDKALKDVGMPKGVVLVMLKRDGEGFIPNGETIFRAGDAITAMGNLGGISRLLERYLAPRRHGQNARRATVVGGGVVGFAVAEGLERANWEVTVIEADEARANEIAPKLKSLVLHGDGTDIELLREERIGEASVLIAVTSNDEKNLLVSLLARQQGVPRIVTRADKPSNEGLFESVGIDVVRSALGAAINTVVRQANRSDSDMLGEFEHGDVKVLRLRVPRKMPPVSLQKLQAPVYAIVGAIVRGEKKIIIPHGSDEVQGGDELLVFCKTDGADATRHFFESFEAPTEED